MTERGGASANTTSAGLAAAGYDHGDMAMRPRFVIPALCVVAFAAADTLTGLFRERAARAARTAGAGAMRVLDHPLPLPPFTAVDLDGRDVSPRTWRGQFALVNVWATWCAPCRIEIPDLVALQEQYRGRLQVIGVLEDQVSNDFLRAFTTSLRVNYPIVIGTSEIRRAFGDALVLPTSYLVDPEGRVIATAVGRINAERVAALIERDAS